MLRRLFSRLARKQSIKPMTQTEKNRAAELREKLDINIGGKKWKI